MSVKYLAWALDLEQVDATHKMVLVVLANRANDDGECWPGQASIARQASMSESSVRRKLSALERAGYIRRDHRPGSGGGRATDMYVLDLEATGQIDRLQATGQNGIGNRSKTGRQPVTGGRIEPSVEPPVEPSVEDPAGRADEQGGATRAQVTYLQDLQMLCGGWRFPDSIPPFVGYSVEEAGEAIRDAVRYLEEPEHRDPPPTDHPSYVRMSPMARSLMGRWKVLA